MFPRGEFIKSAVSSFTQLKIWIEIDTSYDVGVNCTIYAWNMLSTMYNVTYNAKTNITIPTVIGRLQNFDIEACACR